MSKPAKSVVKKIEADLSAGLTFQANNLASQLIIDYPDNVPLLRLYGLSLARLGATSKAREYLERAFALDRESGETAGILARVYKDIYKITGSREFSTLARDTYLHGYQKSGEMYPGINAAAMSMVLGERLIARKIVDEVLQGIDEHADSYWELATLGEAQLLIGNTHESIEYYKRAIANASGRIGDVSSSYHQLTFLADYIDVPEQLLDILEPPRVAAFSGHMIDTADRPVPRFPESASSEVKKRLGALIDSENIGVGYCSAACGADILFIEALLERDREVHVILPFKEDDFLETSVAYAGEHWVKRYHAALKRSVVTNVTSEGYFGGDEIYRFLGKVILGKCLLRGAELSSEPLLVTVSAVGAETKIGGAIDVATLWPLPQSRRNINPLDCILEPEAVPVDEIAGRHDPKELIKGRTLPLDIHHTVKCILFADIVGYSKLQEDQTPFFMYEVLHAISDRLVTLGTPPEIINTWGDAIFTVFNGPEQLMHMAELLRDVFVGTDWPAKGLPKHLNIRIALHAGPVFIAADPIRNNINGYGTHINRTARIEPITLPGCIYASAQFAALLKVETQDAYRFEYVGRLQLPKNAGLQDLYHISSKDQKNE